MNGGRSESEVTLEVPPFGRGWIISELDAHADLSGWGCLEGVERYRWILGCVQHDEPPLIRDGIQVRGLHDVAGVDSGDRDDLLRGHGVAWLEVLRRSQFERLCERSKSTGECGF